MLFNNQYLINYVVALCFQRWIFSTAFDPVHFWGFEDHIHMSEHLKTCPFYQRTPKLLPKLLPSMEYNHHHSPKFAQIMSRMYPGFQQEDCENSTSWEYAEDKEHCYLENLKAETKA